jgi:hypothetical protein
MFEFSTAHATLFQKEFFRQRLVFPALEIAQMRHDFPGTRYTRVLVNRAIRTSSIISNLKFQEEFHEVPSLA